MKSSKMPLSVRRNCHEYCNLDLSLLPPNAVHGAANDGDGEDDDYDSSSYSSYLPSSSSSSPFELGPAVAIHDSDSSMLTTELLLGGGSTNIGNGSSSPSQQEEQKITIFFNGRVCVSNVTEAQAREILSHARRESGGEIMATPPETPGVVVKAGRDRQLHSPINGVSMKRSLQRFLQKRKNRVATSLQLQ